MGKKKEFTYLDAITEIISGMEVRESAVEYPDMKAAVTHFLQNPDEIPQGLPETGREVIEEYRPTGTWHVTGRNMPRWRPQAGMLLFFGSAK